MHNCIITPIILSVSFMSPPAVAAISSNRQSPEIIIPDSGQNDVMPTSQSERYTRHDKLLDYVKFPDDYDINAVPPGQNGGPLLVNFSINLASILAIDEPNQVISLESTIRMSWYDTRLNVTFPEHMPTGINYLLFNRDPVRYFWFPDVFIGKAKELRTPSYKIPPVYLRIFEDSKMLYSARVNYDLACPMSFENYPVDVQECEIKFESWGTVLSQLVFKWRDDDTMINKNIRLNQHTFEAEFTNNINTGFVTGSYPGVILRLKLKRQLSYHMWRTYLPSFLFVTLAWFSMFIPIEHVPGRVTMSMTTLLTLASMFGSIANVTPPISYTTKLDVWIIGCIVFVFATLFEFTVVIFLKYYLVDLHAVDVGNVGSRITAWVNNDVNARSNSRPMTPLFNKNRNKVNSPPTRNDEKDEVEETREEKNLKAEKLILAIEKFSVFVFLFSFLTFNIFYWLDLFAVKNEQ